jgi:protein TonB
MQPASRGVSPGRVVLGVVVVGALVLGLLGFGVYRLVQRMNQSAERSSEELVDFADSAETEARRERPRSLDDSALLSALESPPELLNREEVAEAISRNYPPLLRDAGVTGSATLRMQVGRDGVVDSTTIEVMESTHEAFGDAAARVASQLRFRPARVDGKPVRVWVTLPITFQLAR